MTIENSRLQEYKYRNLIITNVSFIEPQSEAANTEST